MIGPKARRIISTAFLGTAGLCFLFGTGVTVTDVAVRAVAGRNVPAAIELTSLSIGLGALLSIPVCYALGSNVTAKLLSELMPNRFGRPLGVLGAIGALLFALLLLWCVGENTLSKLGSPETTADLGLPIPVALVVVTLALAASAVAAVVGLWSALTHKRF